MEIVLNDYSISGQFEAVENFTEYVIENLRPIFDMIIDRNIVFSRKQNIYDYKITKEKTLNDLLVESYGNPSVSVLRWYIQELGYQDPYWDREDEIRTIPEVEYVCPKKEEKPNCFTEAIERNGSVLSFPNSGYDETVFCCKRNNEDVQIFNIRDEESFLNTYLQDDISNIRYVIEQYPFKRRIKLAEVGDRCYALDALLGNNLTVEDMNRILSGVKMMLEGLIEGKKNHYWDRHQDEIWEFRVNVSSGRALRLFFIQETEIIFLNGFIKKSQETPQGEIGKAIEIKKCLKHKKE